MHFYSLSYIAIKWKTPRRNSVALSAECLERTPNRKRLLIPPNPSYEGCEASSVIDGMNHRSPIKALSSVLATINPLQQGTNESLLRRRDTAVALHQHLGLPRQSEEKIPMDPHTVRWRSHGAPHAQAVPASQCLGDVSHTSAGGPSASSGPENDSVLYTPPFGSNHDGSAFSGGAPETKRPVCELTRAIALQRTQVHLAS